MNMPLILPKGVNATMRTETCSGCKWMNPDGDGDLTCRRNPPQATVLLVPAPPPRIGVTPQPFSTFPIVTKDMWCGAWESRKQSDG